jgi:hypothetical protein
MKPLPSQEYLHECFEYDSQTGMLTWKNRPEHHFQTKKSQLHFKSAYAGKLVDNDAGEGYYRVCIDGSRYKVSRIVWKLFKKVDPLNLIDHINSNRKDNRIENLREATHVQNAQNKKVSILNKLGLKGVYYRKKEKAYYVEIKVNKLRKKVGSYKTAEEAHKAYCEAVTIYHDEYANFG